MEIPKTIIDQINSIDRFALGAYGAKNFITYEESEQYEGGLSFDVNGLHFQGKVYVMLNWLDEYEIRFVDENQTTVNEVKGVYCDMLVDVLDFIEEGL
jgi:hypothetical protein